MKNKSNQSRTPSPTPPSEKTAAFLALLEQRKALDPTVIELENSFADALVLVTATSRRHAQGLADALGEFCHDKGHEFLGMEGYDGGEWILVDCNDLVIHIFLEETRNLYKLEELWSRRPRSVQKEQLP